jgi:multidrug efflux system outer membrane protein
MNMRRFLISAVLVSFFLVDVAWSGEVVSLDQFLDIVRSGNDMIVSETKSLESAYLAAFASLSDQRPSLGATVSGNYLTGQRQDENRESDIGGFEIRLGVTQPIDIAGQFSLRERYEILSCELRRANLENRINNSLAEASEAYWSAVIAAENIALQTDVLRRRVENKKITDEKYRMKYVPKLDVIRAEALVSAAESLVAQAEAERLDILALMASLAGGREVEPAGISAAAQSLELRPADCTSIDNRPDVRAGCLSVELAAIARELSGGKNAPTLEASANWVLLSEPSHSSSPQMGELEASLRLIIPILDGGAAKNEMLSAKKLVESAEASLRHIENAARREAVTARNGWNRSVALERAKRSEMELSNEELRITELMYREGMGAQIDLINAEIENHEVRTEYLDAVRSMYLSMIQIERAAGGYAKR